MRTEASLLLVLAAAGACVVAAAAGSTLTRRSATLTCATSTMDASAPKGKGTQIVLGRAGLPRGSNVLQLDAQKIAGWRFAKQGFWIRDGGSVTIEVPGPQKPANNRSLA